jgi:hypothetical protein
MGKKSKNKTFSSWEDVLNWARNLKGNGTLYVLKAYKPGSDIREPHPLLKDQRRYWKSLAPTTFKPGQGRYNSDDSRYKQQTPDDREVHATLDEVTEHDVSNELIGLVEAHPKWRNRNIMAERFNDNVDISGWAKTRNLVKTWHISLHINNENKGGWFGIEGKSALPGFTPQKNEKAVASDHDQKVAITIHGNMNNHVL